MFLLRFVPSDPHGPGDDARPRGPTPTPPDASTFGVYIFLITLAMLFGASMVGYAITRIRSESAWDGYQVEGLRGGLVLSTALVLGVSGALHLALRALRKGGAATRFLLLADALALAFLVSQIHNWRELIAFHGGVMVKKDLSLFLFYALTALHALHVVGGYVPLAMATARSSLGRYSATSHRGLLNCAIYWHFLDAVWIVMAIALFIG